MRCSATRSTSSSTTPPSPIRNRIAAFVAALLVGSACVPARAALDIDPAALYKQMKASYDKGAAAGWHLSDKLDYFSTVLDAGRGYELRRRDDPQNVAIKGVTVDLATQLAYDPLTNNDAAEWYVRNAAQAWQNDPDRGANARALIAKLDAEDGDLKKLAYDADADATSLAAQFPNDVIALLGQMQADLRAYQLTGETQWRLLALQRAAGATFPIALIPQDVVNVFLPIVDAARNAAPGYSDAERAAAKIVAAHRASTKGLPSIGRVVSHESFLLITAPADEYFGRTKLSPIGVRNEITRIGKYLDAGWGPQMTKETLWVVDSLDDWQHQYPRDYELPRLYKRVYDTLARLNTPEAKAAQTEVRRTLLVGYPSSTEARAFLST